MSGPAQCTQRARCTPEDKSGVQRGFPGGQLGAARRLEGAASRGCGLSLISEDTDLQTQISVPFPLELARPSSVCYSFVLNTLPGV